jgi:hypothetical protein
MFCTVVPTTGPDCVLTDGRAVAAFSALRSTAARAGAPNVAVQSVSATKDKSIELGRRTMFFRKNDGMSAGKLLPLRAL